MESFKDENGKSYDIHLTIGIAKKIKSRLNVDLLDGDPTTTITGLVEKPFLRSEILWIMVEEQAGCTQDEFDSVLGGSCFREATVAFWREIGNFIQEIDPARAKAFNLLRPRMERVILEQTEAMIAMADSPEMVELMGTNLESLKKATLRNVKNTMERAVRGMSSTNSAVPSGE